MNPFIYKEVCLSDDDKRRVKID